MFLPRVGWFGLQKDGESCEGKTGADFPEEVYLGFVNLCCWQDSYLPWVLELYFTLMPSGCESYLKHVELAIAMLLCADRKSVV